MTDEPSGMPSALREVHRQGMPGRAFHYYLPFGNGSNGVISTFSKKGGIARMETGTNSSVKSESAMLTLGDWLKLQAGEVVCP